MFGFLFSPCFMKEFLKKYRAPLVIVAVLATHLTLGLLRLESYSAVDEPYWTYQRTPKFWKAIAEGKWRSTNINDKPGITTAILSGAGLLKIDPLPYKSLRDDVKTDEEFRAINDINFFFRLPIFLFCFLSLPVFFLLLKKLFDETTALVAFILIGFSPILFGISLIINPDSLLWIFLPLSVLSYFVFQKNAEKKYLYMSGLFLGFSILTKYVANILYIFFFALPFLEYLFSKDKPALRTYLKQSAINYIILVAISCATFFAFFPATWKHPEMILEGTFLSKAFESTWPLFVGIITLIALDAALLKSKTAAFILEILSRYRTRFIQATFILFIAALFFVALNTFTGMSIFNTDASLASPKGSGGDGSNLFIFADNIVADLYSLMFGISPLALFALIATLTLGITKRHIASRETRIAFFLSLFIFLYYIASTVNHVIATVRYQITLFPFACILAAIGISFFLTSNRLRKYQEDAVAIAAVLATFIFSLISLLSVKPYYFAYTSFLLPEPYFVNLKDMGDGSWEAADFLNHLPNPREISIWSDKGAVCAVFIGECRTGLSQKDLRDLQVNYVVVSSGRRSRTLKLSHPGSDPIDFKKAYETNETTRTFIIGNRSENFIKILPAENLFLRSDSSDTSSTEN